MLRGALGSMRATPYLQAHTSCALPALRNRRQPARLHIYTPFLEIEVAVVVQGTGAGLAGPWIESTSAGLPRLVDSRA